MKNICSMIGKNDNALKLLFAQGYIFLNPVKTKISK
jgi:hypothetical protein